jgi:HEPN domain-containing protein
MNGEKEQYIKMWLEKAEDDLQVYNLIVKDENTYLAIAGFHLQQTAEKYMKAFLEYNSIAFAKSHDIEYLLQLCSQADSSFAEINFINLTDYAVDLRYPGDMQPPSKSELEQAYKSVQKIKHLVISLIKF